MSRAFFLRTFGVAICVTGGLAALFVWFGIAPYYVPLDTIIKASTAIVIVVTLLCWPFSRRVLWFLGGELNGHRLLEVESALAAHKRNVGRADLRRLHARCVSRGVACDVEIDGRSACHHQRRRWRLARGRSVIIGSIAGQAAA